MSDEYRIDLPDTLQIVAIKKSVIAGATLITADEDLAYAAKVEGISVLGLSTRTSADRGA